MDYCWRCGELIGQKDAALGIKRKSHYMTDGFIEMVSYVGQASASFEDAKGILEKLRGIEISASQIQKVTEEVGAAVYKSDMEKSSAIFRAPERYTLCVPDIHKVNDILYILMDGSAVNTRIQDENGSTWKEMKLGMVFRDKDVIKRDTKDGNNIITKKDYCAYFGEVGRFKELLYSTAVDAGYGTVKNVVVIGDGAHWIWNLCEECYPDAIQILDYYHLAENVYSYAKALYPNDDKKMNKWAKTVIWYIKTDQYKKALRTIKKNPLDALVAEKTVNIIGYLENNKNRINYLQYNQQGYYIGSGMIEGGNKVVIQKRMKQCGMRWSVHGGQYIASLRTKSTSKKWQSVKDMIYSRAS